MDICFGLAVGAAVLLRLPSPVTLAWQHSVGHFHIEEQWSARADGLVLLETRTGGLGAGVDLPDSARWVDGLWRFKPALPPQRQLQIANSRFGSGYRLCWSGRCSRLDELIAPADVALTITPCGSPP